MRLTLGQACNYLNEYVEYGMCATDPRVISGVNRVVERLLPALNPEKTIGRYEFPLINETITLPREIKTVMQAALRYPNTCPKVGGNVGQEPSWRTGTCSLYQLVLVKSRWYELLPGGPSGWGPNFFSPCAPNVLMDLGTGWSTFSEPWNSGEMEASGGGYGDPYTIRVYADIPQLVSEGTVFINGLDVDGNSFYEYDAGVYHQALGIPIPAQGQNYTESTKQVSQIYSVTKPITKGRIKLFAVDPDDGTQIPIAIYAPDEIAPDYRRYRINAGCQPSSSFGSACPDQPTSIVIQAKRQFVWTVDLDADILITNLGALENGLMARKFERAGALDQAALYWRNAVNILESETKDYDGDYTTSIQLQQCYGGGDIWNLK